MATILILDDDRQVRDSLAINLEDEGFDVMEAGTAETALDLLDNAHADLAVVDLRLPGMDGAEFIRTASARWPALKFIVYTGSPKFQVPPVLTAAPNVSVQIFLKPLGDYDRMNEEIARMIGEGT